MTATEDMNLEIRREDLDTATAGHVDGRSLRRARNRAAVIVALLDLIREGDLNPGAAEIADRAGVSHRSVFRYFDDLDDLVRTAIHHEFETARALSAIPGAGQGPTAERVRSLVSSRVRLFDYLGGALLVTRMKAATIPAINEEILTMVAHFEEQVRAHFEPELAQFSGSEHDQLVDACIDVTSFASYDLRTRVMGRSTDEVQAMWSTALTALLRS